MKMNGLTFKKIIFRCIFAS